jgi:ATP-dependent DNA helicase RecG
VYRNDRWEYPVIAIREIIRNAVIHRDYSLTGKDIKISIFDDKIEITSPGKLMPTIDFSDMDSGQSDIRNKVLAPVFKKLRIIEQWGNGLKLIAEDLKIYPEIDFDWKESGIAFRVTFSNKNYRQQQELQQELQPELQHQLQHQLQQETMYGKVLKLVQIKTLSSKELSESLGQKSKSGQLKKVLAKLLKDDLVEWTEQESAKSSKQQYRITQKGKMFLNLLNK